MSTHAASVAVIDDRCIFIIAVAAGPRDLEYEVLASSGKAAIQDLWGRLSHELRDQVESCEIVEQLSLTASYVLQHLRIGSRPCDRRGWRRLVGMGLSRRWSDCEAQAAYQNALLSLQAAGFYDPAGYVKAALPEVLQ